MEVHLRAHRNDRTKWLTRKEHWLNCVFRISELWSTWNFKGHVSQMWMWFWPKLLYSEMQKKPHSFKDTVICYKDTWVNIKGSEHGIDSNSHHLSLISLNLIPLAQRKQLHPVVKNPSARKISRNHLCTIR